MRITNAGATVLRRRLSREGETTLDTHLLAAIASRNSYRGSIQVYGQDAVNAALNQLIRQGYIVR